MTPDEAIKLLGLNISEDATDESLKKAYRRMVLKHHPDRGGNAETFLKIKEAYETVRKYIAQRSRSVHQFIPGTYSYVDDVSTTTTPTTFSWTVSFD